MMPVETNFRRCFEAAARGLMLGLLLQCAFPCAEAEQRPTVQSGADSIYRMHVPYTAAPAISGAMSQTESGTSSAPSYRSTMPLLQLPQPGKQSRDSGTAHGDAAWIHLIEILQWIVVVAILAVVAVLMLKKWTRIGSSAVNHPLMKHLATLPVRGLFHAHLLQIGKQQFLVTSDRSGVKTVTTVAEWDDFESALEQNTEEDLTLHHAETRRG